MKHPLPPLDALKVFEASARHLSFSKAADELCLSKGGVSYQIRKLEQTLNLVLFKRSVRQILLTDAGQQLFQVTQQVFRELNDTIQRLGQGHDSGNRLVIGATTYVAARWLSPRVTAFCQEHTHINVTFQHAVNDADFELTAVDLAIRWGPCDITSNTNVLHQLPMPMFAVCNTEIAHQLPKKLAADSLQGQTLLSEERQQDLWLEWAGDKHFLEKCNVRVISDANVRVQAAIDGQGLMLADDMMINELRNQSLQRVYNQQLTGYGYAIMRDPNRMHSLASRLFQDWLLDQLSTS